MTVPLKRKTTSIIIPLTANVERNFNLPELKFNLSLWIILNMITQEKEFLKEKKLNEN